MVKQRTVLNRHHGESSTFICSVCGSRISSYPFVDNNLRFVSNKGTPASLYWNNDRKEVYCGPQCSIKSMNPYTNKVLDKDI